MGGAVADWIEGTLMQATMTSDNFTGLAGTSDYQKFANNYTNILTIIITIIIVLIKQSLESLHLPYMFL